MSALPLSPRGDATPHLRLNSGSHDIITDDTTAAVRPSTARTNSARSLTQSVRPGIAPSPFYANAGITESAELLPLPQKSRMKPFRDESPLGSPSNMSSRRTSWESDMTRDSRSPFASPFDDSRAPSRAGSDEELNTQTVSEKFNIHPSAGLLLFPEDVETDDYLHNPDPNEKEKRDCNIFTRRGAANLGGLALFAIGLLFLFIGYPILYVYLNAAATHSPFAALSPFCRYSSLLLLLPLLTAPKHVCRQVDACRGWALHQQSSLY
jgi:hypothetical protein